MNYKSLELSEKIEETMLNPASNRGWIFISLLSNLITKDSRKRDISKKIRLIKNKFLNEIVFRNF